MSPVTRNRVHVKAILFALTGAVVFCGLAGYLAIFQFPFLGAEGADLLRAVFGNQVVGRLETLAYDTQDAFQRWEYQAGILRAVSSTSSMPVVIQLPTQLPSPTFTSASQADPSPTASVGTILTATPTLSPTATLPLPWQPPAARPLGSLPGEGIWQPFIITPDGLVLAYRTSIQPDPERPYAVSMVIAFDLQHTSLHYVLGTQEPSGEGGKQRTGLIPAQDRLPGVLLATFNGGFKATHGHFGAMAGGVAAIPARDGLGSLRIDAQFHVHMGEWGNDLAPAPDDLAWRQNGPLIVHNGQINPRVGNLSPQDWGYTVDDVSPTWRSAIGLSQDERTLFYAAGPALSVPALASVMLAAGAYHAIQLDINNYWVHFVTFHIKNGKLVPDPLFPEMMKENLDRYLWPYSRDYFYVTIRN